MRALLVVLSLLCLSSLCECQFTDSFVVNMTGYSPNYTFYSKDALFVLYQAYFWGSQPILSKIDPSSGETIYDLTIPFTRCYPCSPQCNGLQVNENFVIITVENGTLWELFTIDIVSAQPSVVGTYTPPSSSSPSFISNLLQDGQNSILVTESFQPGPTTSLITYDSTGATITVTPVPAPSFTGIEGIVYGAINLTPNMALMCTELSLSTPYDNLITFETTSGKEEAAINAGWGYNCPIASVSTQLQGICAYYTTSSPAEQQLWCWDYSVYPSLIPPSVSAVNSPGTATAGVVDDAGNFIGCYSDNSVSYLVQYTVNYEKSTYELVATAPVPDNYRCFTDAFPRKQITNNRISTTLQQVATLVATTDKNGEYVSSVLVVNYGSSSKNLQ